MKLAESMAGVLCEAACREYDGATRKLFAGDSELAAYEFGTPAFGAVEFGEYGATCRVLGAPEATATAGGVITRFVDFHKDGHVLLYGSVGLDDSEADCIIGAMPTRAGQVITIESMFWFQPYE